MHQPNMADLLAMHQAAHFCQSDFMVYLTWADLRKKTPKMTLLQPKTKSFAETAKFLMYGFCKVTKPGQMTHFLLYEGSEVLAGQ
jgi:hypothetical protein